MVSNVCSVSKISIRNWWRIQLKYMKISKKLQHKILNFQQVHNDPLNPFIFNKRFYFQIDYKWNSNNGK